MTPPRTCPRCHSDRMILGASLRDYYGDTGTWSVPARAAVDGNPSALVFKDRAYGDLLLDICGACGHVDLRIENFQELYEKYRQSLTA